jgi:hypothetical protein
MSNGTQRNYVNAGGLYFFGEQVPTTFEEDVLACNLYLQLAASVRHDKFNEASEWRHMYLSAMSKSGFGVLRRDVQSIPLDGQGTLWNRVEQELSKWVSSALVQQAQNTLTSFADSDGEALALLKSRTTRPLSTDQIKEPEPARIETGHSLPIPAGESGSLSAVSLQLAFIDRAPAITLVFFSFKTISPLANLPFPHLIYQEQVAGNLELTKVTVELQEHFYKRLRKGVLKKLGSRFAEQVIEVEHGQPGAQTCLIP